MHYKFNVTAELNDYYVIDDKSTISKYEAQELIQKALDNLVYDYPEFQSLTVSLA